MFHTLNRRITGGLAWMMDPLATIRYVRDYSTRSDGRSQGFRMQYFVVNGLDDKGMQTKTCVLPPKSMTKNMSEKNYQKGS